MNKTIVGRKMFTGICISLLAALLILLYIGKPAFFRLDNIESILIQTSSTGIMTFGLTFILVTGGIDISMPMVMLLASVCGAMVTQNTGNTALGIATMFLVGFVCGSVNGLCVSRFKMMPFIVTLIMQGVAEGAATLICYSTTYTVPASFMRIGNGRLFGFMPAPILYLAVLGIFFHLLLNNTAFGRYTYGIGINEEAAATCGVNTTRVKYLCYMMAGLTTAVSALITTARLGSASPMMVSGSTSLDVVCAAIIGGASINGGVGSIPGAFIGALLITIVQNVINLFGLNAFTMYMIKGGIILLCTYYDSVKTKVWGRAE